MDIYNIPMAEITTQYLATLDVMQSLNLDVAGEFLLMSATLIHIKSRLLLPQSSDEENEEEEDDPRAELVKRLLEYYKYREAALDLDTRSLLGRDVFARGAAAVEEIDRVEENEIEAVDLFELVQAFRHLLREKPEETFHDITTERLSVTDRVNFILSLLAEKGSIGFSELFTGQSDRQVLVVTFLAMLELVKMRAIRLLQTARFGPIWLMSVTSEDDFVFPGAEAALGYR
jgi:segregation and condensation protein A